MTLKRLRYAGFAEENSFNPDTPPAADIHVDITSTSLDTPADAEMVYEGGISRGKRTRKPAFYSPDGDIVYGWDIATIGRLLKWALGEYVFTEETDAPNIHEFYGTEETELDSFTARLGKDVFEHVFVGCVIDSLELEWDDGFCLATVSVNAARDERDTLQQVEDLTLPDGYPLDFTDVTVKITHNTTEDDISCEVKSGSLTISNNLDPDAGRGAGSRFPCRIIANERELELGLSVYLEDQDWIERFHGDDGSGPDDHTSADEFEVEIIFEANMDDIADQKLTIDIPKAWVTAIDLQPSGKDELEQELEIDALIKDDVKLADDTEVSTEVLATLENEEGEYT